MIKRLLIAIVGLGVVCGGLIYFNFFRDQMIEEMFANMPVQPVPVEAVAVETTRWTPGIEAIGTASAAMGVDVAVEVGGVVQSIPFTANEEVRKGQLLLQIDDAVERADLLAAEAAVARDQQTFDRTLSLSERGVTSAQALDEAIAALESSRSVLARVQAVIDQKAIEAPFDGTIGIPRVEIGQYVQPGTVIATLQNIQRMKVDFTVPEQLVGQISLGQPVSVGAELGALSYAGRITGIDPKVDPTSRLVSVQAELDNPEGGLRPGQFVRVRIELPEEDGIIAVPQTAVVTSLYGDHVYLVVEEQGQGGAPVLRARQAFVTVGRRDRDMVEITEGLAPGDIVVTAGQNRLDNGMPVTLAPAPGRDDGIVAETNG